MPTLTQQQIDAGKSAADSLHARLNKIYQQDMLVFGNQDSLAYGRSNGGWRGKSPTNINAIDLTSDLTDISIALDNNDAPGLYGWDLIGLEDIANAATIDLSKSSAKLRNNIPVKDVIAWIRKVHKSGGINTVCWHMRNPSTKGDYNDLSDPAALAKVVTANSSANKNLISWLDKAVNFFSCLLDDNGMPIPVIFRPYHEVTNFAAFFWWNQINDTNATASDYQQLWEITISHLYDKGISHLLNAFCMNDFFIEGNTGKTFDRVRAMIPDPSLYDIIGFDAYQRLNTQEQQNNHPQCNTSQIGDAYNYDSNNFISRMRQQMDEINELAIEFHKIPALTEFGADYFFDDSSWWTNTVQQIIADKNIAYLMTWRNPPYQEGDQSPYYSAYYDPQGPDLSDKNVDFVNDFIEFYNSNAYTNQRILFLKELSNSFG